MSGNGKLNNFQCVDTLKRSDKQLHKELIWNKTKTSAIQDGKINLLQFTFHVSAEAAIY